MVNVRELQSDQLSTFRTSHIFRHYAEFSNPEEFCELVRWGRQRNLRIFILGNGSNTLFTRNSISTLVLRNRLARKIEVLDDLRVEVSSSLPITTVLKHCEKNGLDSFYYLASVPATIGGAIAMNAGRGRKYNMTIFDFVESVTYIEGDSMLTLARDQFVLDYRHTLFTGVHDKLIVSAILKFPRLDDVQGKIRERVDWSKDVQDHSAPNCGSVFREGHLGILRRIMGIKWSGAQYSPKVINWILNNNPSPRGILRLIGLAKLLNRLIGRRAKLELIEVD